MEMALYTILGLISFILAVFPIVIIHEFGHFLVGKYLGAEPEEFSVGFGKSLLQFQWLGANFKIGWIPLGGYVKFKKMQFDVEFGEDGKKGEKISAWRWIWISLAGPASNFALTFVLFFGFLFLAFNSRTLYEVQSVKNPLTVQVKGEDYSIKAGDRLVVFDGNSSVVKFFKRNLMGSDSESLVYLANEPAPSPLKAINLDPSALASLEVKNKSFSVIKNVSEAASLSGVLIVAYAVGTADALVKLVSTKDGYKGMMGPAGIANEAEKARSRGFFEFFFLMASLSFAVGFFNLLPLSFLDGGRALMALFETVTRKAINAQVLGSLNLLGFALFIALFVVSNLSDFLRFKESFNNKNNPAAIEKNE